LYTVVTVVIIKKLKVNRFINLIYINDKLSQLK